MSFIVQAADAHARESVAILGGKGRALASLTAAGMPVPDWFAIPPAAWHASLSPRQRAALAQPAHDALDPAVLRGVLPDDAVIAEIQAALPGLAAEANAPDHGRFAVRSSAADEDSAQQSFAGQLDSYLFVAPADIADRVARVWASAFGERALAYRRTRGLPSTPTPPAVIVQRMVDADVSGVAFSADPVSGRRSIAIVSAVYGLGTALVSGDADADTYAVDRDGGIVKRRIADKRVAHRRSATSADGVEPREIPMSEARRAALSDEQIAAVAALARAAQRHFGQPQDIEWALAGGRLFLLQARPITSLAALPDPDAEVTIWDNSNIAESYGGMTTPLTFTFARRAYDGAYRQFFRLLRIPDRVVMEHDDTFRNMLGFVRGRIYYNLLNWYRLLALLPGFRTNRRFMEQMMGVKEALPESVVTAIGGVDAGGRLADAVAIARTSAALIGHHLTLRARMRRFYQVLDAALDEDASRLALLRPDEIVAQYRRLERRLVNNWDAPLINDFFAMVFYGVLRRACTAWCGDEAGTLQNDLLCGSGGMISARPAQAIRELSAGAAADTALVAALDGAPASEALAAVERNAAVRDMLARYMDEFGDRCDGELKLESPTLRDDPLMLLRAIGRLAAQPQPPASQNGAVAPPARLAAERRVSAALARSPLRRLLFNWIVRHARGRIVDRENLRFARTRLFGRIRAIFIELGRRLTGLGALDDPRDIFYLGLDEALGFVEGAAASADLRALVAARKAEFDRYRRMPPPADRFETRGAVYCGNDVERPVADRAAAPPTGPSRTGIGCCPGTVRGSVRVVRDPHGTELRPGEILVAERTDPSWVMLFPAARGILVERGSLLSHAAIVAREMGIPAVVSIEGLTAWLHDGDDVEFDGASGVVTRIQPAAEPTHAQ